MYCLRFFRPLPKGIVLQLCLSAHGCFSRMIKAWQLSHHLNQSLTLKPLEEALRQTVCEIHHSDQGVQYLSKAYITTRQEHSVEISVAQRGRPWEKGYAERLIRTLKEEEVHFNDYQSTPEARDRIGHLSHRCIISNFSIRR